MNRRQFLLASSMSALAGLPAKFGFAESAATNIGVQLFSVPKSLEKNFRQGIALLAQLGYKEVEFYGPYSFSAPYAITRWSTITPQLGFSGSGFFGLTASQARAILDENGMAAPSMHTDLDTLQTKMNELAGAAHVLGSSYVVLPSIPQDKRQTLDDYKKMAEAFNVIGEQAQREGLKFAYHNHGYGLHEMEGHIPLNVILEQTDPRLVSLEMDIFWMTAGGGDPVEYLKTYPDRYRMMHLKDMKKLMHFKGDGGDPSQWIDLFQYMTTVGDGVLDIKAIVAQARKSGVEHLFVEQDMAAHPKVELQRSIHYLKAL